MTFVTVPPAPASPENAVVEGDGWWPDIDCNVMRDELRLGDTVPHARLVAAIEGGLITVDGEMADWRTAREADGITELAEFEPERTLGGKIRAVMLFTRAVRFAAAAELAELHRDMSATAHGQAQVDDQKLTAADYRRLCTQAIRDLIGTTRCTVELI